MGFVIATIWLLAYIVRHAALGEGKVGVAMPWATPFGAGAAALLLKNLGA